MQFKRVFCNRGIIWRAAYAFFTTHYLFKIKTVNNSKERRVTSAGFERVEEFSSFLDIWLPMLPFLFQISSTTLQPRLHGFVDFLSECCNPETVRNECYSRVPCVLLRIMHTKLRNMNLTSGILDLTLLCRSKQCIRLQYKF